MEFCEEQNSLKSDENLNSHIRDSYEGVIAYLFLHGVSWPLLGQPLLIMHLFFLHLLLQPWHLLLKLVCVGSNRPGTPNWPRLYKTKEECDELRVSILSVRGTQEKDI